MRSANDVTALVLAAGQSRRMGQPKMTLPLGESTVIGTVVTTLAQAGLRRVLVVTGAHREGVEQALSFLSTGLSVTFVYNPDYAASEMLSSIQVGLHALGEGCQAALITLGDQPQMHPGVVKSILASYTSGEALLVVPSHQMRRGHPWIIARSLWPALLALPGGESPRHFLAEHADFIEYVAVETPSVLMDMDTPDEYEKLRRGQIRS